VVQDLDDRVEQLARRVDALNVEILNLHRQDEVSSSERSALRASLTELNKALNERAVNLSNSTIGYSFTAAIMAGGAVITFTLNRLFK
jgi:predicted  nucleic acid-binding Zn-ribbon protein